MDLYLLDSVETADLFLDFGHAGRAGESLSPQDGVGGGGGSHCENPFHIGVHFVDIFTLGTRYRELLDLDQVRPAPYEVDLAATGAVAPTPAPVGLRYV